MSKCRRCNIDVLDHSLSCPLCNGVLEYDPVKDPESEKDFLDHSQETGEKSKSVMYYQTDNFLQYCCRRNSDPDQLPDIFKGQMVSSLWNRTSVCLFLTDLFI